MESVNHIHNGKEKLIYLLLNHSTNIHRSWCYDRHWGYNRERYKNRAYDIYSLIGKETLIKESHKQHTIYTVINII